MIKKRLFGGFWCCFDKSFIRSLCSLDENWRQDPSGRCLNSAKTVTWLCRTGTEASSQVTWPFSTCAIERTLVWIASISYPGLLNFLGRNRSLWKGTGKCIFVTSHDCKWNLGAIDCNLCNGFASWKRSFLHSNDTPSVCLAIDATDF